VVFVPKAVPVIFEKYLELQAGLKKAGFRRMTWKDRQWALSQMNIFRTAAKLALSASGIPTL
jgi:hypothetical protein